MLKLGILGLALLLTAPGPRHEGSESLAARLGPSIAAAARVFPGQLSLFVRDVRTGEEYALDAERPTYLSSTIKVVVALEVLREVDAGELRLDRVVVLGPSDVRDGVGPLRRAAPGLRLTVADLLELMLARSDNAAADLLIKLVGVERLEEQLRQRGIRFGPLTSLLDERRRIYGVLDPRFRQLTAEQVRELGRADALSDRALALSRMAGRAPPWSGAELARAFESFYAAGFNAGSMRQMGMLLDQVARCSGLSPGSCKRLHALMRACRTGGHRIRAGLPPGTPWAHKTGTQYSRACDVGVFWLEPDHPVVVAACVREFSRLQDAEAVLARVGRATWAALQLPN